MKRIFAAVKIHPGEELVRIFDELKKGCLNDRITWVDPKNIHITLKFFGETEEERIHQITNLLRDISLKYRPFDIHLSGIGMFGSSYKPRVVWIGIDESPTLAQLGQEILDSMETLGFIKDRQNFIPHLTLGRIKHIENKKRFSDLIGKYKDAPIYSEMAGEFYLIESQLSPKGPLYTVLETFDMKNEKHQSE